LLLAAFPEPQRPGGGGGTGGELAAAAAAVVLVAEQANRGTGGTGGRGGTGGTGGTAEPGAVAEPEELAGLWPRRHGNYGRWGWYEANGLQQSEQSAEPAALDCAAIAGVGSAEPADSRGACRRNWRVYDFNTNDLLGGLQRIASEQNEFYLLGYVPADSPEGSCHTLKVKLNHGGGMNVRSRTGYCNARSANVLEGTRWKSNWNYARTIRGGRERRAGAGSLLLFGANVARVNLAMDIPGESFHFDKDKGKYHANLSVLGIGVQTGWNGRREIQRSSETRFGKRRVERIFEGAVSLYEPIRCRARILQNDGCA